jgi:hypothetical protein
VLFLILAAALAVAPPKAAIELPQFRIEYTAQASNAAHALALTLGDERAALTAEMGEDYPGPTLVYVAQGVDQLAALVGPEIRPPRWASGLAIPRQNVLLFDSNAILSDEARRLVRHELAHLALAAGGGTWPRWFQEGFAMAHAGEWSLTQYAAMYRVVARGAAIPLRDLSDEWPDRALEREVAYAESAAFVQYLRGQADGAAMRRLIQAVRGGQQFESAFFAAFGSPLDVVEQRWRDAARSRYTWVPLLTGTGTLWAAITVLFLLAYARVRSRRRARMEALAVEEHALAAAHRIAQAEAERSSDPEPLEPENAGRGKWLH